MNEKIKNFILYTLKEKGSSLLVYDVYKKSKEFSQEEFIHIMDVLVDEKLVKRTESTLAQLLSPELSYYIELTSKGYTYLKPWYKKSLNLITEDMSKIFSLLALIVSFFVGLKQLGVF